jgi:inositol 2-dehydrogenase
MSKLGVGVLGVGRLGRRHAENLKHRIPDAHLVAVADSDPAAALQVAKDLELEHSYPTVDGLLEQEDVQAIVIATPSNSHSDAILAAARSGKHVFCEKPIALTLEAADAALAAVRKAGVQFQLGFMRRFDPAYASAKQRVDGGDIGDPVIFKSVGRDKQLPPPRFLEGGVNGTIFSDAAIHDFDLARWMMNDEIVDVHAFAGILACPEMELYNDVDATTVNLRFGRGGIGNVEAFRKSTYGYDIRTEILGTKGALQVGYLQQTPFRLLSEVGITHDVVDHWLERFADAYRNELHDFVGCILEDRPIRATGEDGRTALAVALAAERSYRQEQMISIGVWTPQG